LPEAFTEAKLTDDPVETTREFPPAAPEEFPVAEPTPAAFDEIFADADDRP
jgi:hypothetical protein